MNNHKEKKWHIDCTRRVAGYPFAVCSPYRDGLPGSAVLGVFAYKPHAEVALTALRDAEKAGKFQS